MTFIHFFQKNTLKVISFIVGLLIMVSCYSTEQTVTFNPPVNFDASTYINPQKYGYDLMLIPDEPRNDNADTTFVPAAFKEDIDDGVQRTVNYPSAARRDGIEGKVILELYIDSTSTLTNIETIQSPHSLLTNSCKKSVINAEYNAATLRGKPVKSFIRMPFAFKMWRPNNN